MADAKVKFWSDHHGNEAAPGTEVYFSFICPKGNRCGDLPILGRTNMKHDPQNQNGGSAHWGWDGNRDKPTFTPSIDCKGCWHGYIEGGRTVSCAKTDEPEPPQRPAFGHETQD